MAAILRHDVKFYFRTIATLFLFLTVFSALAPVADSHAQGITGSGLAVAPTRLAIDPNERGAELRLQNRSATEATYRITLTQVQPGPGGHRADEMIRFSPRQVTVAGNGNQTVRVAVRRPADLPPGEYAARIRFEAIPTGNPTQAFESAGDDGISIQLEAIYAVTLSVVIHQD
ncbi:fimbria/pilus periplasmic chaperone [Fodinicurvata sp. EGI_FJ10296]|uniref:fimbrial biogenesis chaperone n=1 Tax=Fodinicurvata sp. EGI_FJ10296 TaxID=3231908 RepID=UPI0034546F60